MKDALKLRPAAGFALIGFLMIMLVSAVLISGALRLAGTDLHADLAIKSRSEAYYQLDDSLGRGFSWLRQYSPYLASPFQGSRFYSEFVRTAPSYGPNDLAYKVPTQVKLKSTSNSAILTNSSTLANAAFPATTHIDTGLPFDAVSAFNAANLGTAILRVTLVDALAVDPSKDYGPPPNPPPQTDFKPVYRIDIMTATDRGGEQYAYIFGEPRYNQSLAVYGSTRAEFFDYCDSYDSSAGSYGGSNRHANCVVSSNSYLKITSNSSIYGKAFSNGILDLTGEVCADFSAGCPVPGQTCAGPSCGVPSIPAYESWDALCPEDQGDLEVDGVVTLTLTGSTPSERCWDKVTIKRGATLILQSSSSPYYFKSLRFHNVSDARLVAAPATASAQIQLYVETFLNSDSIDGHNLVNGGSRPGALLVHYLGTAPLSLKGNRDHVLKIVAPYAEVQLAGSYEFFGSVIGLSMTLKHGVHLHLDEALARSGMTGMTHSLKQLVQAHR